MISNLPQREEYLRKKRKKRLIRWVVVLFLIIFIFGASSYITHRQEFRISKVVLSGGVLVTESDLEKETLKYISGKYFWVYPKDNAFLYKRKDLRDHLKDTFKRIDTIELELQEFQTLLIKITERKPYAIWCDKLLETNSDQIENCYFIDQNSTIFAPAPHFSGDAYFKFYGKVSTTTPIGSYYISSSTEFIEMTIFIDNLRKIGVRPQYLIAKDNNEFSVVVFGGGEIYFDTKESLGKTGLNLAVLLETPEFSSFDKSNLPIEYIDLRFGNKLFYKLKE